MRSLRATASLVPSSRFLTAAMLDPHDFSRIRTVAELGPGTGAVTCGILKRLAPDGRLFALDTNEKFVDHLQRNCRDRRLIAVHAGAEELLPVLSRYGVEQVDAVVSSLGLTSMEPRLRTAIVSQASGSLVPGGLMTQYQYFTSRAGYFDLARFRLHRFQERPFLRQYFREISTRRILLNFPPAVVFVCRK
jgi:phospholipid N-methyltransferase